MRIYYDANSRENFRTQSLRRKREILTHLKHIFAIVAEDLEKQRLGHMDSYAYPYKPVLTGQWKLGNWIYLCMRFDGME